MDSLSTSRQAHVISEVRIWIHYVFLSACHNKCTYISGASDNNRIWYLVECIVHLTLSLFESAIRRYEKIRWQVPILLIVRTFIPENVKFRNFKTCALSGHYRNVPAFCAYAFSKIAMLTEH